MLREMMLLLLAASLTTPIRSAAAEVKNPDTFIFVRESDPADSLDPAWAFDGPSLEIVANVYDFLVAYRGANLSPLEAVLAEQVPDRANNLISRDGRTYTFPIRKGVVFHDGTALGPEDARAANSRSILAGGAPTIPTRITSWQPTSIPRGLTRRSSATRFPAPTR